jgi:hypothetical protein
MSLTAHLGPLTQHLTRVLKIDHHRLVEMIRAEIETSIQLGRLVPAHCAQEAQLRTLMMDTFETIVQGRETLPGKMMFGLV